MATLTSRTPIACALEEENRRLRQMVNDQALDIEMRKGVTRKGVRSVTRSTALGSPRRHYRPTSAGPVGFLGGDPRGALYMSAI